MDIFVKNICFMEEIISLVCMFYGIERDAIRIKSSTDLVSEARAMAMYILHCDKGISSSVLAREFEMYRNSIFHIVQKARARLSLYSDFREKHKELLEEMKREGL